MNKIKLKKIDSEIYEEVLENGLRIYLSKIPRNLIHARMTSLFGGSILEFKTTDEKDYKKMPAGVAHFLEHKLFEKKDFDPVKIFEENGASCNAFTTPFITSYYFNGVDNFYRNLENLLRLVNEPYFTDENIQKEKGIISQEKKADLDNPYAIVYDKSLKNTFKKLDYKNTVLGSLKDINSITKEDLYRCYNCFYHPSNMILTIAGNINIEETLKYIKDYYNNKTFENNKSYTIKEKTEPEEVVKEKEYIDKNIKNIELQVNYKVKKLHYFENEVLNNICLSLIFDLKFGVMSDLIDITQKNSNFVSGISSRYTSLNDYYYLNFNVTLKNDEEEGIKLIDNHIKDKNYNEEDFNLIKKSIISSLVLSSEDTNEICDRIIGQIRNYNKIIDNEHELISKLTFEDLQKYAETLNFENRSIVVLKKAN